MLEMDNLDETDNKLIKLLEQNAWQSSGTLANVLHVSAATIRRRLRRLIQKGVLRAVAIVDSGTVAPTLNAIIALNIAHQDIVKVMKKLADLSEIVWCGLTTGQFDAILLTRFHSTEDLHGFLREKLSVIEGIKDSETFVCIHVERGKHLLSID